MKRRHDAYGGHQTHCMPRSSEIDRFSEKLSLMRDRSSLSRVQLAQAARVEKSVASRCESGQARPSDQSIVRLTELVRREVADFARSDWNLTVVDFAMRLGIALPQ